MGRDPKSKARPDTAATTDRVRKEVTLSTAAERLNGSVAAMRMALEASDKAAAELGMLEGGAAIESLQLRRRWVASSSLLHGALLAVERDSKSVADAVTALLTL